VETKIQIILKDLSKLKIRCKFDRFLLHNEPSIVVTPFAQIEKKLEKVCELFQVSRQLNHITQQVILCLKCMQT
jgi:hypothetical protein